MKAEYRFTNFVVQIERVGIYDLEITGMEGEYRYRIVNNQTREVVGASHVYRRAMDAERAGQQALADRLADNGG